MYLGVKLLSEADLSSPSVVELNNEWSYTTTPPIYLHGVYRGNFKLFNFSKSRGKREYFSLKKSSSEWRA
jgi:hypothetical protein